MPRRFSPPKFRIVEKRRLFLPPEPPGTRCTYVAWNGARCQRDEHGNNWHVYSLEPGAKRVRIYSDRGRL